MRIWNRPCPTFWAGSQAEQLPGSRPRGQDRSGQGCHAGGAEVHQHVVGSLQRDAEIRRRGLVQQGGAADQARRPAQAKQCQRDGHEDRVAAVRDDRAGDDRRQKNAEAHEYHGHGAELVDKPAEERAGGVHAQNVQADDDADDFQGVPVRVHGHRCHDHDADHDGVPARHGGQCGQCAGVVAGQAQRAPGTMRLGGLVAGRQCTGRSSGGGAFGGQRGQEEDSHHQGGGYKRHKREHKRAGQRHQSQLNAQKTAGFGDVGACDRTDGGGPNDDRHGPSGLLRRGSVNGGIAGLQAGRRGRTKEQHAGGHEPELTDRRGQQHQCGTHGAQGETGAQRPPPAGAHREVRQRHGNQPRAQGRRRLHKAGGRRRACQLGGQNAAHGHARGDANP